MQEVFLCSVLMMVDLGKTGTGADPEGGAPGARPPKIGKNMIFLA